MAHEARMSFCEEVFRPYDFALSVMSAHQLLALDDESLLNWINGRLRGGERGREDFPNLDEDGGEEAEEAEDDDDVELPVTRTARRPRRALPDPDDYEETDELPPHVSQELARDAPRQRIPTGWEVNEEAMDADYVNPRTRAGRIARIRRQMNELEADHEEDYLLRPTERAVRADNLRRQLLDLGRQLEELGHNDSRVDEKIAKATKPRKGKDGKVIEPKPKPKVIKRRLSVGRKRPPVPPTDE